MFSPFISNKHVKQMEESSTPQCIICYETSANLMQCKGPCRNPICLPCVSNIRSQHNKCPARCTNDFQVEPYPDYSCQFLCPYNPQQCSTLLPTRSAFQQHSHSCAYITQSHKQQLNYRQNFRCPSGHLLTYLNQSNFRSIFTNGSFFHTTRNLNCFICKEKNVCNAVCIDCCVENKVHPKEMVFCVRCRALPCSRKLCPIGHELQINHFSNNTLTCDLCGMIALVFDKVSFGDRTCNFDICLPCHNKLPEDNHMLPLANVVRADFVKPAPQHSNFMNMMGMQLNGPNNINELLAYLQQMNQIQGNEVFQADDDELMPIQNAHNGIADINDVNLEGFVDSDEEGGFDPHMQAGIGQHIDEFSQDEMHEANEANEDDENSADDEEDYESDNNDSDDS